MEIDEYAVLLTTEHTTPDSEYAQPFNPLRLQRFGSRSDLILL